MTENAIELNGLSKTYRSVEAVSGLHLHVPAGTVYGFIGPNGAGKTTVMRMLLGLVRPTSGTGRLLGRPLGDPAALRRTGSLVESPAFYPYLSGRRNLELLGRYVGAAPAEIRRLLELVALEQAADSRYRTYSLGMKQRLGVAAALLGEPELLILDEPANGLDPAGVAVMRDMLRALGDSGRTVLLSSHLLDEVAQICDRVAILDTGRLLADGTLAEVRSACGPGQRVVIRAEPLADAARLVRGLPGVAEVAAHPDRLELTMDPAGAPDVTRALVQAGIAVHEVSVTGPSLEQAFLQLTSGISSADRAKSAEVCT
ncbi:MAG: ATP-binding cassette domain-containing protein [Streptosporangiaceae bacterium]|jgi:ABC-2 type transport system ATP-binding protein